jgi:hypothetical protein
VARGSVVVDVLFLFGTYYILSVAFILEKQASV